MEEERRRITAEVHDRIAQTLAGVFQQLQTLQSLLAAESEARRVTLRASSLLREAIRECWDIMNELHPPGLDEFGVVPLLEEELEQFRPDSGCLVRFLGDRKLRRSGVIEIALYRVFHEALTNIRKHAPTASKVLFTLGRQDQAIMLQVEDDGRGFDVTATRRSRHMRGLMTMQQRAELIGGTLEVQGLCVLGGGSGFSVRPVSEDDSPTTVVAGGDVARAGSKDGRETRSWFPSARPFDPAQGRLRAGSAHHERVSREW